MKGEYVYVESGFMANVVPYLAAFILAVAIWDARRGRPVIGRVCSAVLLLVLSIGARSVNDVYFIVGSIVLTAAGANYDAYQRFKTPFSRWIVIVTFALTLGGVCLIYRVETARLGSQWGNWAFSDVAASLRSPKEQITVQRNQMRILEYTSEGYRYWHVKDGIHNVEISADDRFRTPTGFEIGAGEMIQLMEGWTGRPREHFRPPYVSHNTGRPLVSTR
jgi:hypothetical protein